MKRRIALSTAAIAFIACAQISGLDDLSVSGAGDASLDAGNSGDSSSAGVGGAGGRGTGGASGNSGTAGSSGGTAGSGGAAGSAGAAGSSGASGTAGAGGTGVDGGPLGCSGLPGPTMVQGEGFCVDSTEVSGAHYAEFMQDAPGLVGSQIPVCTWNTSFEPFYEGVPQWPLPGDEMNLPVRYVDWCDAYAYCGWAGKRLCGRLGGGSVPYDQYADRAVSQWMQACTSNGNNAFPYGGTYDEFACNTEDNSAAHGYYYTDVGTMLDCHGFGQYANVFDMSGNVLEWEDSCGPPADGGPSPSEDLCRLRGGSIFTGDYNSRCDWSEPGDPRNGTYPGVGFRCCKD